MPSGPFGCTRRGRPAKGRAAGHQEAGFGETGRWPTRRARAARTPPTSRQEPADADGVAQALLARKRRRRLRHSAARYGRPGSTSGPRQSPGWKPGPSAALSGGRKTRFPRRGLSPRGALRHKPATIDKDVPVLRRDCGSHGGNRLGHDFVVGGRKRSCQTGPGRGRKTKRGDPHVFVGSAPVTFLHDPPRPVVEPRLACRRAGRRRARPAAGPGQARIR